MDVNLIKSQVIIHGEESVDLTAINVQGDDLEKEYELECIVKLKSILAVLENNTIPRHQIELEIVSINKFKEES